MCELATHIETKTLVVNRTDRRDPSRTTQLRATFAREMQRRFRRLMADVFKAVADEDVFGLLKNFEGPATHQTPGPGRFDFPRNSRKVTAFMKWLDRQVKDGILDVTEFDQVGEGVERAWTNKYIADSYKRGVQRARYEMRDAGYQVPTMDATGGIAASMSTPFHIDRVGLLFTRSFNELKGITDAMDQQVSRILAQGLADGLHPRVLARQLVNTIGGPALGLTDKLGRFMPAARRAEILARTEIIRAHAEGQLQEYENWRVEGVNAMAEFTTAGDDRVCEQCWGYEGSVYSVEEARGIIPVHPQCRCVWLPTTAPLQKQSKEEKAERRRLRREARKAARREGTTPTPTPRIPTQTPSRVAPTQTPAASPEPGIKKWVNETNPERLVAQLRERARINMFAEELNTADLIKRANVIGQTMADDVASKLPDLIRLQGNSAVPVTNPTFVQMTSNLKSWSSQVSDGAVGFYIPQTDNIVLGVKQLMNMNGVLRTGPLHNVGIDLAAVMRHEYGHHVYHKMNTFIENVNGISQRKWNGFFGRKWRYDATKDTYVLDKNGIRGKDIFRKEVSMYSSTNADEAFAESFAAYTHPEYAPGVKGKSLPKFIENLLTDMIGKRTDL